MKELNIIVDDVNGEYELANELYHRLSIKGYHPTWSLGPVCSRDHANHLADLKKAVRNFLDAESDTKEYRRTKQALHSRLKQSP